MLIRDHRPITIRPIWCKENTVIQRRRINEPAPYLIHHRTYHIIHPQTSICRLCASYPSRPLYTQLMGMLPRPLRGVPRDLFLYTLERSQDRITSHLSHLSHSSYRALSSLSIIPLRSRCRREGSPDNMMIL